MSDKTVNVELFALSYGSLVRAIVKETNNIDDANAKLIKIGNSIGMRITDDLVVHYDSWRFENLKQAGDRLIDAFKNYLGVNSQITESTDNRIVIRILDNPVTKYVTIPLEYEGLIYLNPLLGAIKTVLANLHYSTEVKLISDKLKKDSQYNEIEIKLIEVTRDTLPPGEYLN